MSESALEAIARFQDSIDCRYRAEAIRQLIKLGLDVFEEVPGYRSRGDKRILVTVGKGTDVSVNAIRKTLTPVEDRTYEVAYRLVIICGLHRAGYPPTKI